MNSRWERKFIKKERKEAQMASKIKKQELLDAWKDKWKSEPGGKNLKNFFGLFESVYQYTLYAKEDNKKENFRFKKLFLGITALIWLVYAAFFVYDIICKENEKIFSITEAGLLFLLLVFLSGIVSKAIDIKKYQETWARHSGHLNRMEIEMMRFVSNIAPYHKKNKKVKFVENILEIWGEDEKKFVHNIEEKEKELMDIYNAIKILRKESAN